MSYRQLFLDIMNYREFDQMPVIHWDIWPETRERWIAEGMPRDVEQFEFLGVGPRWCFVGARLLAPFPPFEEEVLEETDEYRIIRAFDGVVQKEWKHRSCIPQFIDFTLKTADDWPAFKTRFQPDPARIPDDLDAEIATAEDSDAPIAIVLASMMGWIRNWMGVQNMSFLMYDAPEVYADMVDTLAELTCWSIDQIVPRMKTKPDIGLGWEDICFRSGPLVNPRIFDQYVAPGYRKIRRKLEEHGVHLLGVDCDGFIEPLLGHWLEAGVNLHYPIEIGVWNADPMALRNKFGKELRMVGGFNKLALEQGPAAIDAEIERRIPIMRDGGYIILPDHFITPGASIDNYTYYLNRIRNLTTDGSL
jgi:uroporphyrinogen decarboxylase